MSSKRLLLALLLLRLSELAPHAMAATTLKCGSCHPDQARTQPGTPMGQALHLPASDPTLLTHSKLLTDKNGFHYKIERREQQSIYSVSDGKETLSMPILWQFGARTGTYVVQRNGTYVETFVSYFADIASLDVTPGDQGLRPTNVEQAIGRPITALELQRCFACHATNAVTNHNLDLNEMHPGVGCARCHTDTVEHLKAITAGKLTLPPRLGKMSSERISEFCGQCHRSWADVVTQQLFGVINVRFEPYRLSISKCFDGKDARVSCVACHDPHKPLVREDSTYDKNCLSCHSAGAKLSNGMLAAHPDAKAMPMCPVSQDNCVSCHMPKTDLPGSHASFKDHDIRVVRQGETYPD